MAKKDWSGILFFISGVILYGFTAVGAVIHLSFIESWNNPPGMYWSAVLQGGLMFPMILSWILMVLGILFMFSKELKKAYQRLSN
ncbi:hypothetical protein J0K78_03615 [Halobacillus sp. GSS1]|uniref:hypothetical protein n=1 Tax=Halobacillus sp. GSS1 TaxID=2815919 RepID=UPI001A8C2CCD|nr:hypothetical protein [Halobacillus sp. GSS1]MBN9653343.1 hypothetical protein [Halobacillus sp. GSS1]